MTKGMLVGGIVGSLFFALIVTFASLYISAYNLGNRMEQGIIAQHTENKNVLAQYSQKVVEAASVSEIYKNDLVEVTNAAIEGRYGENGSQAVFQWIQENNPQLDPTIYTKVQQIIESGRNEFQVSQTRLIELKRVYQTAQGNFLQGFFLKLAGYPKINLDDYKIVTTTRTERAFESGVEDAPIKLR